MENIVINLDEMPQMPSSKKSLIEMVAGGRFEWPSRATCCTQDADGMILWWDCEVAKVQKARQKVPTPVGLVGEVGFDNNIESELFNINEQDFVATDWQKAVVTKSDYLEYQINE